MNRLFPHLEDKKLAFSLVCVRIYWGYKLLFFHDTVQNVGLWKSHLTFEKELHIRKITLVIKWLSYFWSPFLHKVMSSGFTAFFCLKPFHKDSRMKGSMIQQAALDHLKQRKTLKNDTTKIPEKLCSFPWFQLECFGD